MTIFEKLAAIQQELRAPKDKNNDFGGFKYRSCEQILEAVKPHLKEYKAMITLYDRVHFIEGRFYIEATAAFYDIEGDGIMPIMVTAFAREPESKKGMDEPQVTGTASSYARKYALNGLLLIDDNKDADTNEYREIQENAKKAEKAEKEAKKSSNKKAQAPEEVDFDDLINAGQIASIEMLLNKADISVEQFCQINKVSTIGEIKKENYDDIVSLLETAVMANKKGEK